jgi:hypothetical protein
MANIELDGPNKKIKVDSGDLTLDVPGDIVLDADGGDVVFADGGTNLLKVTNSSSDVVLQPQVDTKDIVFKQYDGTVVATVEDNATFNIPASKLAIGGTAVTSTAAELNILDGVTATATELNLIDGVTSTTAELNIVDGGTSATSTTLADADRVVVNDNGTMVQVAMSDVKTYIGAGTNINLFRAYRNGNQTINHSTVTKVQLNAETFDVNSKFDSSTNHRYTPASTGYYKLHAQVSLDANNSSGDYLRRAYLHIYKNGSSIARLNFRLLDSSDIMDEVTFSVDTIDNSSDTDDYYEVFVEANNANGSNNCDVTGGTIYTYFTGYKLIT